MTSNQPTDNNMTPQEKEAFETSFGKLTPIDNEVQTSKIVSSSICDSRFNRFDDEIIEKYFNQSGKEAIAKYVASEVRKGRIEGAENMHKHIFNHFDLLSKIQSGQGSRFSQSFNEENYQVVACDYLNQLNSEDVDKAK